MDPVPEEQGQSTTGNCGTIISTNCILWQGADIPCITTCTGDSLTDVITKLGAVACAALDIGVYNTTPLTEDPVEDFASLVQLIIDTIGALPGGTGECDCDDYVLPALVFPLCMQGAYGTEAVPLDVFSATLGTFVCDVIDSFDAQLLAASNAATAAIQQLNKNLSGDIKDLESEIALIKTTLEPTIIVGTCAMTGVTPGASVTVSAGLTYLETVLCGHHSVVGDIASLNLAIASQCTDLGIAPQFAPGAAPALLNALPNWSNTPATVGASLTNLWLAFCDLRAGYDFLVNNPNPVCVVIPVTGVVISSITSTTMNYAFTPHGLATLEEASSYDVSIYAYDGFTAIGPALVTSTLTAPTISGSLSTGALNPANDYVLRVVAQYSCGTSIASEIIGKVVTCTDQYRIDVVSEPGATNALLCNGGAYNQLTRNMKVQLKNTAGTSVVNNITGVPMVFTVLYRVTHPQLANDVWESYTFTIPHNSSESPSQEYISYDQIYTGAICEDIDRANIVAAVDLQEPLECFVVAGPTTFTT